MKKFFAILMAICMMASMLCVPAFAAGETYESKDELPAPAADVVIRVTAIKGDKIVHVGDYTNFEDGWFNAIHEGLPRQTKTTKYERMIVDFYADWTSADDGNFTDDPAMQLNSEGFNNDTIEIPDDVKITINLNGHTIKRVLPDSISDGEVMYIDEDADVIINNGTITGGKSTNGAGGIHIHDANVTLNDVHIVGNLADNDDGGGIALYDGAVLVMNGGSFRDNTIDGTDANGIGAWECMGGAIYINDSTAIFNGVEFKNNQNTTDSDYGAAIYVDDGEVSIDKCIFDGNGIKDDAKGFKPSLSIIHAEGGSTIDVKNSTFTNNGYNAHNWQWGCFGGGTYGYESSIFVLEASQLTISGDTKFTNNATVEMFSISNGISGIYVSDATFTDNGSDIINAHMNLAEDSYFRNCTFNNNMMTKPELFYEFTGGTYSPVSFKISDCSLTMYECDMGNSTYKGVENIKFVDCENAPNAGARRFGSIFGEGSLTMIVALLALIASGVSIFLTVYYNKKKAVPVTANNAEETEDEE